MQARTQKLTPEQIILECRGCLFFFPGTLDWCKRTGKRETGKHGKCLSKIKAKT